LVVFATALNRSPFRSGWVIAVTRGFPVLRVLVTARYAFFALPYHVPRWCGFCLLASSCSADCYYRTFLRLYGLDGSPRYAVLLDGLVLPLLVLDGLIRSVGLRSAQLYFGVGMCEAEALLSDIVLK
jgi:hypothetical protein